MFIGKNGENQFSLKIVDYEFPENRNNEFDANWLIIAVQVQAEKKQWQSEFPALFTWEVQQLIDWVQSILDDKPLMQQLAFTESNVTFSLGQINKEQVELTVYLSLEFKPSWVTTHQWDIPLTVTKDQLQQWITLLEEQLLDYPVQILINEL